MLAAAERLGNPVARAWAQPRVQSCMDDAEQHTSLIAVTSIKAAINAYEDSIGDLEPLAADVDHELDSLLRRESAASPATATAAGNEMTSAQKREKLRDLLRSKVDSE